MTAARVLKFGVIGIGNAGGGVLQLMKTMPQVDVVAIGQNLIVVEFVRQHFSFDSVPAALGIGVLKASPLILTVVFLWRHGNELLRSYGAPAWNTL